MSNKPISSNSAESESELITTTQERTIFRAQAEQHYLANQEKVVFPRLVSKRLLIALWIFALSLFILGSLITFWPLIDSLM